MLKVISVLHHSIQPLGPGRLAEEDGLGWHFRTARALAKLGGHMAVAARPGGAGGWEFKTVEGVLIALAPAERLSPSRRLWKWDERSPALAGLVRRAARRGWIPYIHEYRAAVSREVLKEIGWGPAVLQHHGSPPWPGRPANPLDAVKAAAKALGEAQLKKAKGAFFVLNRAEKERLEELGVDAEVRVRMMAADFEELRPPTEEEKIELRRRWGIREDAVIAMTYVGVFREEYSTLKGAHLLPRLRRDLGGVELIATGLGGAWAGALRKAGVRAFGLLPHREYLELAKASDLYILPATPGLYGGVGVAVMEALALGKPVVSPTLVFHPEPSEVKGLGRAPPFIRGEEDYKGFLAAVRAVAEDLGRYKPWAVRGIAERHYSWRSFVRDFEEIARRL